ncbi:unnamed protein product [Orchesella dallaii]|uniref:Beta/gamma crystallin 'Greek key' domain-containing protein n=1 Tax=Orchesella dallaii TaxID=48710 RepID=A0ABP1RIN3_9HEXA
MLAILALGCGAHKITVFKHADHRGASLKVDVSQSHCTSLPRNWDNQISSINTHGACVIIFDRSYCQGRGKAMAPGTPSHNHLGSFGFNDKISSFKQC